MIRLPPLDTPLNGGTREPLYVHIPFCRSKCDYCDYFSVPNSPGLDVRGARFDKLNEPNHTIGFVPGTYIDALINEIHQRQRGCKWDTVYVGGGTPSLMTEGQIRRLFDAIWQDSGRDGCKEVTFEANPKDVDEHLLKVLSDCGVTRISVGFQSLEDSVLCSVHRESTRRDEEKALEVLKNWSGIFSADMIAGLPGETEDSLIKGIDRLIESGAEHISLYTLTVEENTPLGRRIATGCEALYDSEKADNLWILGRDELLKRGYEQYEVSNFSLGLFCKGGAHSLHNEAYWQMKDYTGCGAGAVSSYYGMGGKQGVRITNTKNIERYIEEWLHNGGEGEVEVLDNETQKFEFFMLGLRTARGVSEEAYMERFGEPIKKEILALFADWGRKGLARKYAAAGQTYRAMTQEGLLQLDSFLREILGN